MRRREFISLIGGAVTAWPLTAHTQQPDRMRRIGVLMAHNESDPEFRNYLGAFQQELRNLGWIVINLKTAKALGLTVPQTLLATADEVIE